MDTPEKNKIATPISKFEDSPVFSYINSLSPIEPVKCIHNSQTFNSFTYASPPSAFTSPQIILHRETRFSKRSHFTDLSKSELCGCENEDSTSDRVLADICSEKLGCLSPRNSATQVMSDTSNKHSEIELDFPRTLQYDCGSSEGSALFHDSTETDTVLGTPASVILLRKHGSKEKKCLFESETNLSQICQTEQLKGIAENEWELISDVADMLIFDSPITKEGSEGQDHETASPILASTRIPKENAGGSQKTKYDGSSVPIRKNDIKMQVVLSGEAADLKVTDQAQEDSCTAFLEKQIISESYAEVDNKEQKNIHAICKPAFQHQRSIRRLVFEMSGVHEKGSGYDYASSSAVSFRNGNEVATNGKQRVYFSPENSCPSSMLTGIGLHLNALPSASKDLSLIKQEMLVSQELLISMPTSKSSIDPSISFERPSERSLNLDSLERDSSVSDSKVQVFEDTSSFGNSDGLNQSSPTKKRRKTEHAGESEACKRCTCKKSKCLKLYCECFAAGLYCVEPCSCQDCFNKPIHEETVLETRRQIESRNPLAFAPKVIRSSESIPDFRDDSNKTPASARHKRGCNCKKSSCLKKYCECFQGGVGCSISCRCEGCKNTFGPKYGTEETELQGDETEESDKNALDFTLQKNVQNSEYPALPVEPLRETSRSRVQFPLSYSGQSPQPVVAVRSSPQLCTTLKFKLSESLCHKPKVEKRLQMIPEDETPEILKGNCSLSKGAKSTSPNCKRVSPPHRKFAVSPAWRSGRKLILRSIPSFPSLAQHGNTDPSGKPT